MDIETLRSICKSFPDVTEDIKWEHHLCFNVGGKMFVVLGMHESPITASFKVSDESFEKLGSSPGMKPAPYLARYKWIFIDDISRLGKKQWEELAADAYRLIAAKLPKKKASAAKPEKKPAKKTAAAKSKSAVKKKSATKKAAKKKTATTKRSSAKTKKKK